MKSKIYILVAIIAFTGFFAFHADAQTVVTNTDPSSGEVFYSVTYEITFANSTDITDVCDVSNPGSTTWGISSPQGAYAEQTYSQSETTGIFTLVADNIMEITQVVANCGEIEGSLVSIDYDGGNLLYTLVPQQTSSTTVTVKNMDKLIDVLSIIAVPLYFFISLFITYLLIYTYRRQH